MLSHGIQLYAKNILDKVERVEQGQRRALDGLHLLAEAYDALASRYTGLIINLSVLLE